MNTHEVPEPILNSPFEEPSVHWRITEHEPPVRRRGRRPAMYFYRPAGRESSSSPEGTGIAIGLKLVNRIRDKLAEWRPLALKGEGGVTRTTMELMRHWRRDGRGQRLFFAQLEAAETIIFLTEARADFSAGESTYRSTSPVQRRGRTTSERSADTPARWRRAPARRQ